MFRLCALFSPCISSPSLYRYYLHVFPISLNCLAPPHFPESLHRTFIPQCIYSPHCALIPCEFVVLTIFLSILVLCVSLLPFKSYIGLAPVSCSCSCSCHLFPVLLSYSVSLIKCCFGSVFLLFIICYPSCVSLQSCVFMVIILGYMFICLIGFDSVFVLSLTSLLPSVFVPCYL